MNTISQIPQIAQLLKGSDYIDVKTIEGQTSLRRFIASMLSYYPGWIVFLYRIRTFLVKLLGLVNCSPDFAEQPKVINGASDFFVEVFGDRGKHARSAVGSNALPFNISVEIEMIVEVEG